MNSIDKRYVAKVRKIPKNPILTSNYGLEKPLCKELEDRFREQLRHRRRFPAKPKPAEKSEILKPFSPFHRNETSESFTESSSITISTSNGTTSGSSNNTSVHMASNFPSKKEQLSINEAVPKAEISHQTSDSELVQRKKEINVEKMDANTQTQLALLDEKNSETKAEIGMKADDNNTREEQIPSSTMVPASNSSTIPPLLIQMIHGNELSTTFLALSQAVKMAHSIALSIAQLQKQSDFLDIPNKRSVEKNRQTKMLQSRAISIEAFPEVSQKHAQVNSLNSKPNVSKRGKEIPKIVLEKSQSQSKNEPKQQKPVEIDEKTPEEERLKHYEMDFSKHSLLDIGHLGPPTSQFSLTEYHNRSPKGSFDSGQQSPSIKHRLSKISSVSSFRSHSSVSSSPKVSSRKATFASSTSSKTMWNKVRNSLVRRRSNSHLGFTVEGLPMEKLRRFGSFQAKSKNDDTFSLRRSLSLTLPILLSPMAIKKQETLVASRNNAPAAKRNLLKRKNAFIGGDWTKFQRITNGEKQLECQRQKSRTYENKARKTNVPLQNRSKNSILPRIVIAKSMANRKHEQIDKNKVKGRSGSCGVILPVPSETPSEGKNFGEIFLKRPPLIPLVLPFSRKRATTPIGSLLVEKEAVTSNKKPSEGSRHGTSQNSSKLLLVPQLDLPERCRCRRKSLPSAVPRPSIQSNKSPPFLVGPPKDPFWSTSLSPEMKRAHKRDPSFNEIVRTNINRPQKVSFNNNKCQRCLVNEGNVGIKRPLLPNRMTRSQIEGRRLPFINDF